MKLKVLFICLAVILGIVPAFGQTLVSLTNTLTGTPPTFKYATAVTFTITLTSAAPTGGSVVSLATSQNMNGFPSSETVPAGATSYTFNITAYVIGAWTVTATLGSSTVQSVQYGTESILSFSSSTVTSGSSVTGKITYGSLALNSITYKISSDNPNVHVPASVTLAARGTSVTFTITTTGTSSTQVANITLSPPTSGSYGSPYSLPLTITSDLSLSSVSVSSSTVTGGTSALGTVSLNAAAGSTGYAVTLQSNNSFVAVPPTVTIPAGATSASFPIWTDPCTSPTSATVTASDGTNNPSASINVSAYSPYVFNVQVSPTCVVGGDSATAVVQLDHYVTTVGGEVVDLSTSNVTGVGTTAANAPSSVIVPFGANSASFTVSTTSVSSSTGVSVTATDTGSQSGLIIVLPAGGIELGLTVSPSGIYGGNSATGTIAINSPQSSATVINLSSNSPNATVPSTVTVPAGSTTATFNIATSAVASPTSATNGGWVWIACSTAQSAQATPIAIYPANLHAVSASPNNVLGGASSIGTVSLSGIAPTGGIILSLSSSSPDAQVPSTVTVPAGTNSATFTITTSSIVTSEIVTISASYNSKTVSTGFGIGSSLSIHTISSAPSSVIGGSSSTGTVAVTAPAPPGGLVVSLTTNNAAVQVPTTVSIAAGDTTATFPIATLRVSTPQSLTLSATLGNKTVSSGFVVGASVSVHMVSISPGTVTGGTNAVGTVTLSAVAPDGGTVISLNSTQPCAQVPATVTIPAGSSSTTFAITTSAVTANTPLSVLATLNGQSKNYGMLICTPNFTGLTITGPTSVKGGSQITVTANLNGPAPLGGVVLTLSSNSPNASVPSTCTIPSGATSANFNVTTSEVAKTTTVTITATHNQTGRISFKITP